MQNSIIDLLILGFVALLVIQIFTFLKIFKIVKHLNKLLFEVRILFKQSGIFYQPQKNAVFKDKSCQYCKYRISFIQLDDEEVRDNFYYRCKKHDIEIGLSDTCQQFDREFRTT
jgi:hypothetical protein